MRAIRPALPWLLFVLVVLGQLLVVGHVLPLAPRLVALERSAVPPSPPANGVYDGARLLPDDDVNHLESHIAYLRRLTHEDIVVATFRVERPTIDQSGVRTDAAWLRDQWWGARDHGSGIVLLVEVGGTGTGGSGTAYASVWNRHIDYDGLDVVTIVMGDLFAVAGPRYAIEESLHVLESELGDQAWNGTASDPEGLLLVALLPFLLIPLAVVGWFARGLLGRAFTGSRGTHRNGGMRRRPERPTHAAGPTPFRATARYWGMTDAERQAAFAAEAGRYPAEDGWRIASVITEWPVGKPGLDLVVTYELADAPAAESRRLVPRAALLEASLGASASAVDPPWRARLETGLRRGVLLGSLVAFVTVSVAGGQDRSGLSAVPHGIWTALLGSLAAALLADLAWYAVRSNRLRIARRPVTVGLMLFALMFSATGIALH